MSRRDRLALVVCAAALAVSVFAVGGAPSWAQSIVALLTAGGLGGVLLSHRRFDRRPALVILILAAAGWTLVQALPLPHGLVALLNPTVAALRDAGARAAGVSISSTLSADPAGSLRAVAFLLVLAGLAVIAVRASISERGRYALVASVGLVTGVAALLCGLHTILGLRALYGIYQPGHQAPLLGPLLNTNHLGGLMAVGALTNAGLFLYRRQPSRRRASWAAAALACLAATMATLSRGAVLALAGGAVVMLATLLLQRLQATRDDSKQRRRQLFATTVPIAVIVMCGLVVAVMFGASSVMQQLESTTLAELDAPTSKYAAWRSAATLVEESPWVGVGRGAFESVFTRVHPASALVTFSHLENEPWQAIVEWGVPGALGLALLGAWMLLQALRRWSDGPLAAAVFGCIVAVAFQSCFDFGMEILGLAAPMVVLLGTLTYVPLREIPRERRVVTRGIRAGLIGALVVAAVALWTPLTEPLDEAHRVLQTKPSRATVLATLARHPLDYLGYAVLAEQLARAGDARAITVLNHALRLHPTHPGMHWIMARLLVRDQRLAQAESEYAMAARFSPDSRAIVGEIIKVLPPERAARALPTALPVEVTVRNLRALGKTDVALAWLERLIFVRKDLRAVDALTSLATTLKDPAMVVHAARRRCALQPGAACKAELARALLASGEHRAAIAQLDDVSTWVVSTEQHVAAWLMLCDAHRASGATNDAADCLRRLTTSGLVDPADSRLESRRKQVP